jgi:uncharacterized protein
MKGLFKNKKISMLFGTAAMAACLVASPLAMTVYADSAEVIAGEYGFVYDSSDLLTDDEEEALQEKLEKIGEAHDVQIAIVTTDSYSQYTIEEYADDIRDYGELGMKRGNDDSAILLAVCMSSREYHTSTRGEAIQILTDDNLYSLEDKFVSYLSSGDYAKAFDRFADGCDSFCTAYENRNKIPAWKWFVCLILGLVCGGFTLIFMTSGMNTVKENNSAADYEQRKKVRISGSHDRFIRKSVSRVKRDTDSGSRGGGSTTHRSSSGNISGGHGGHF